MKFAHVLKSHHTRSEFISLLLLLSVQLICIEWILFYRSRLWFLFLIGLLNYDVILEAGILHIHR